MSAPTSDKRSPVAAPPRRRTSPSLLAMSAQERQDLLRQGSTERMERPGASDGQGREQARGSGKKPKSSQKSITIDDETWKLLEAAVEYTRWPDRARDRSDFVRGAVRARLEPIVAEHRLDLMARGFDLDGMGL